MGETVKQAKTERKDRKVKQVYLDSWDPRVMPVSRGSQDRRDPRAPGVSRVLQGLQDRASAST